MPTTITCYEQLFVNDKFRTTSDILKIIDKESQYEWTAFEPLPNKYLNLSTSDKAISIRDLYLFTSFDSGNFSLLLPFGYNTFYDECLDFLPGHKVYHERSSKSNLDRILSYIVGPYFGILSIVGSIRSIITIIKNSDLTAASSHPTYLLEGYRDQDTKRKWANITKYTVCKAELSRKTQIVLIAICMATITRGIFECFFLGILFLPGDLLHLAISKCYKDNPPFEKINVKIYDQIKEKFVTKS